MAIVVTYVQCNFRLSLHGILPLPVANNNIMVGNFWRLSPCTLLQASETAVPEPPVRNMMSASHHAAVMVYVYISAVPGLPSLLITLLFLVCFGEYFRVDM